MFRSLIVLAILAVLTMAAVSCGGSGSPSTPDPNVGNFDYKSSDKPRDRSPQVSDTNLNTLVTGNSEFAWNLYKEIGSGEDNLFYSPYSISIALAMTWAGARTDTESQMSTAMHYLLSQSDLHPSFDLLDLKLASRGKNAKGKDDLPFRLRIANSIWGQKDFQFLPAFLDTLSVNYGAGLRLLDFINSPDPSRVTINDWVAQQTEDKIKDLIPEGAINEYTRLVLTNAIYFNAAWKNMFEKEMTKDGDFHLLDGSKVTVPMMEQVEQFKYASGDVWRAVELPYDGDEVSMLMILPDRDKFKDFESSLDNEKLNAIVAGLADHGVHLVMPKFKIEGEFSLSDPLVKMGMPLAFDPEKADFSGMDGDRDLYISDVIHKAYCLVDEKGTEAAAATAVIVGTSSAPVGDMEFVADHPFIFLIRDNETGTILFVGRVTNPSPVA